LWTLTPEQPLITLHATSDGGRPDQDVLADIQAILASEFELRHATIQMERKRCRDDACLENKSAGTP